MKEIKLLDCTLRDGGYLNDWEFGYDNLVVTFERLVSSGVDFLEVGFLNDSRGFDKNRSIFPTTACADAIYGHLDKGNTKIVGMIDYGTCAIENIAPCSETCLDGIRVIFKKHIRREAIAFCRQVKELGYMVFVQAVSITSYTDEEFLDLCSLVNDLEPYSLSLVDTYGLLHQNNLLHYFRLMCQNLKPGIGVGYHSHNNFQLAYSNAMDVLKEPTDRIVLLDASLYGMGKSAGNLPIELISMHLNEVYGKNLDISQMMEAIAISIMPLQKKFTWGYSLFFYIAASNRCHPNYVQYLMDERALSFKAINEILSLIEDEKKLLYDRKYIETLVADYLSKEYDDDANLASLKRSIGDRPVLVLGPGKNVLLQKDRVNKLIEEQNPAVISVNYVPEDLDIDYAFLTNSFRYITLYSRLAEKAMKRQHDIRVIATSNITDVRDSFDYVLNYASLIDTEAEIHDNSFLMFINVLLKMGIRKVYLAGFDGYKKDEDNYYNPDMDYRLAYVKQQGINQYVAKKLASISGELEVCFITDTQYV